VGDLRLKALRSDHFLPVVLGYTPNARVAEVGIDSMLNGVSTNSDIEQAPAP
jgi:hypothetical protein